MVSGVAVDGCETKACRLTMERHVGSLEALDRGDERGAFGGDVASPAGESRMRESASGAACASLGRRRVRHLMPAPRDTTAR
jgi:hypothetical protein